ncbi:hypothetical protein VTK26DRAFT_1606 [Humicola hyalothermophila]
MACPNGSPFGRSYWFSVGELQRVRDGLPMTTLELTALSFSVTMMITSLDWYEKPTIARPITLSTKDGRSIDYIRSIARETTPPRLPQAWYRTPLDFIPPQHRRRFGPDLMWSHFSRLGHLAKTPIVSREVKARPWDRIPSHFSPVNRDMLPFAIIVHLSFTASLIVAWNFDFPTEGEKIAWRARSLFHAVHSISVAIGYIWVLFKQPQSDKEGPRAECRAPVRADAFSEALRGQGEGMIGTMSRPDGERPNNKSSRSSVSDLEAAEAGPAGFAVPVRRRLAALVRRTVDWLATWRNLDPDGDPDMELQVRTTFIPVVGTVFYLGCRVYFYVEDFASMRQQPAGVYRAVNKFFPFMS